MTSATVHSHPAGLSPSRKHRSPSGSRESFAALLPSSSHPTKTSHDENWPPPRWRVALAACIVHGLHMGAAIIAPSVLLSPMRASLHLSVASMSLPLAALRLSSALFLLPAGTLIDRVGAARVVWPGVLLAAFCGVLAPVGVSLPHLISVQVAFAASTLLAGLTPMVVLVDAEFPRADASGSKGAAIGAVLAGFSGAGALVPPVLGAVEERFGWRAAWGAVNAVFATVGVPLTYVYLQGRGVEATAAGAGCGKREAVFSRAYVTLLVMMAALAFSIHIVMDHLVVYLREDVGLSFQRSTSFMSLYHLVAVVAKLVTGRLSDAYNHRVLFGAASALGTVSCFFLVSVSSSGALTLASSEASILCFVVMFGYGYSSILALIMSAMPAFGKQRLGLRTNLCLMLLFGVGSVGSFAAGAVRTASGSYARSFMMNAMCWVVIVGCAVDYALVTRRLNRPCVVKDVEAP